MAETPNHITITVDEDALRAQVQRVIGEELREAAFALRRAADALDPEWIAEHNAWVEADALKRWEAEREEADRG
ncbi:hypothetical protein [Agromyces larvae]|uniref:Type II toxin-antitoxin system CcdA family antitoxin n=1 Tax=Agromyces larvae TaxID=2929802 RepID=A0ABY4C3Y6_9MICO|nr:hypothetical protein [Agromyces larvae]UOE45924.1 hypothetical protein MTO99_09345 [Agromyces larvae]